MKKKLCILLAVCVFAATMIFYASAADKLNDGTYAVAITLLHSEKDKSSMGNNYIEQNALLEVRNGKKYLTMVPSKDVDNLQFWYYNDGSVSGDSTEAEKTENVTINGKTYSVGYTFPIVSDAETVGVRFKAPIMPVTPSARVKIDYGSATAVQSPVSSETTQVPTATQAPTTTQVPTTQPMSTTQATETQPEQQVTESTVVQTTENISIEAVAENVMADETNETVQNTTDERSSAIIITVEWSAWPTIFFYVIAVCFIALLVFFIRKH